MGSGRNKKDFVCDVVTTRNYLTHYDEKLKDKARTDVGELYKITQNLKNLIELCFFYRIGF